MSNAPTQQPQPTGPSQGPDPGGSHPGCADAHRRGQDERADPGDHPGRRRRDGFLLQPLRDQGTAVRGCRRGSDGRLRSAARRPDRGHRGPRGGVRLQLPAHRTAARREPELSRVLLNNVLRLLSADNGLAPRARRDIKAAVDAGRFDVEDLDVAVTMTAGALLALGQLLHDQPDRDVEETTDQVTEDLLRMFGVPPRRLGGSAGCRCRTSRLPWRHDATALPDGATAGPQASHSLSATGTPGVHPHRRYRRASGRGARSSASPPLMGAVVGCVLAAAALDHNTRSALSLAQRLCCGTSPTLSPRASSAPGASSLARWVHRRTRIEDLPSLLSRGRRRAGQPRGVAGRRPWPGRPRIGIRGDRTGGRQGQAPRGGGGVLNPVPVAATATSHADLVVAAR